MKLETARLELVPATVEILKAARDREALAALLGCRVPESWPFEHADEHLEDFIQMCEGEEVWVPWLVLLRTPGGKVLVGDGGFMGPPEDGFVSIGYEIDEARWNQGIATEAVVGLCVWAFSHPEVASVQATTLPDGGASQRVLAKAGFKPDGVTDEGYPMFSLTRSDLEPNR